METAGETTVVDGLTVTVLPLDSELIAISQAAQRVLSDDEQRRRQRLRRPGDRDAYLVAHVELRQRLHHLLELPAAAIRFKRDRCPHCGGPTGRPRTNPFVGIEFSISHTDGLVAIALAQVAVGVDVQRCPTDVSPAVLRGLHPDEMQQIRAFLPRKRPDSLTRCWVRKEAILKGTGAGIGHGINQPVVGGGLTPQPVKGWRLIDLITPASYAGALAVAAQPRETS